MQCIIWGSLYIEAVVNHVAANLLYNPKHREGKAKLLMWELAERAELDKKIEALAEMFEDDEAITKQHLRNLKKLIRIRNKLVHFKDSPTPVNASFLLKPSYEIMGLNEYPERGLTFGDVLNKVDANLPNPEIVHSVLSMSLDARRIEILEICEWLASLRAA